jgi:hypothetical protein
VSPIVLALCFAAAAADAGPPPAPAPAVYRERGVRYFEGGESCPLAGVGGRGPKDCNRLALDDAASVVTIDRAAKTILWRNDTAYPGKSELGDLMMLGHGKTERGGVERFAVHVHVYKKGAEFSVDVHSHPTVRDPMVGAELEPWHVAVVAGDGKARDVYSPEQGVEVVKHPSFSDRAAAALVDVVDNLAGRTVDPKAAELPLADVIVTGGLGKASIELIRAELVAVGDHAILEKGSLPEMFNAGGWELRLTALSRLLPSDSFRRPLFLIGLAGVPILERLEREGLPKGETFVFGMRGGKGIVRFRGKVAEVANAADIARAYVEFDFLGSIVAREALRRTKAGTPAAK